MDFVEYYAVESDVKKFKTPVDSINDDPYKWLWVKINNVWVAITKRYH